MAQMLKRFSSLVLVFMIAGSVFAGSARLRSEHICKMAGMEISDMKSMPDMDMSGMETMPCCKDQVAATTEAQSSMRNCCVTIPQEPGSTRITFNLRSPSFSVAIIHSAVTQPVFLPRPGTRPYVTYLFLPSLQATYIRNLFFLI